MLEVGVEIVEGQCGFLIYLAAEAIYALHTVQVLVLYDVARKLHCRIVVATVSLALFARGGHFHRAHHLRTRRHIDFHIVVHSPCLKHHNNRLVTHHLKFHGVLARGRYRFVFKPESSIHIGLRARSGAHKAYLYKGQSLAADGVVHAPLHPRQSLLRRNTAR